MVVRRLVAVGVVLGALGVAAPLAHGQAGAGVSVKGAGGVTSPFGACSRPDNLDHRAPAVPCGAVFAPPPFNAVSIVAVPHNQPAGHWQFARWEGCPIPQASTCTIPGIIGNVTVVFEDILGPTVNPGAVSYSTTADRTVQFSSLTANEPTSGFECSVDNGAFTPCTRDTPFTLPEGPHQIRFRGHDRSGNVGATTAPQNFNIIDTALVSGPPDFHSSKDITFKFSTLAGFSFDCSLDDAALADCGNKQPDGTLTRSFSNLPEGPHTFRVRARNGADLDHVPIERTWTVDTVPPDTGLDPNVGPDDGDVTTLLNAAFSISANEPASLQCRLAPADFGACGPQVSFADLPFGQHSFQARAVDRAGNVDASPASRTWNVVAVDIDGDGFNQRSDCNENDPNISPGRPEIRGNAVDENCDGAALPFTRLRVTLSHTFKAFTRYTTFSRVQLKNVPNGATVRATCAFRKKKCSGKARKAFSKRRARGTVSLNARYKGVRLKAGTRITVTVTAAESVGAVKVLEVRRGKAPKVTDRCLPPGARRPQRC